MTAIISQKLAPFAPADNWNIKEFVSSGKWSPSAMLPPGSGEITTTLAYYLCDWMKHLLPVVGIDRDKFYVVLNSWH